LHSTLGFLGSGDFEEEKPNRTREKKTTTAKRTTLLVFFTPTPFSEKAAPQRAGHSTAPDRYSGQLCSLLAGIPTKEGVEWAKPEISRHDWN